eukprot:scaffold1435_cov267-Pinguiococcus_pyrenoidosus.AAC.17
MDAKEARAIPSQTPAGSLPRRSLRGLRFVTQVPVRSGMRQSTAKSLGPDSSVSRQASRGDILPERGHGAKGIRSRIWSHGSGLFKLLPFLRCQNGSSALGRAFKRADQHSHQQVDNEQLTENNERDDEQWGRNSSSSPHVEHNVVPVLAGEKDEQRHHALVECVEVGPGDHCFVPSGICQAHWLVGVLVKAQPVGEDVHAEQSIDVDDDAQENHDRRYAHEGREHLLQQRLQLSQARKDVEEAESAKGSQRRDRSGGRVAVAPEDQRRVQDQLQQRQHGDQRIRHCPPDPSLVTSNETIRAEGKDLDRELQSKHDGEDPVDALIDVCLGVIDRMAVHRQHSSVEDDQCQKESLDAIVRERLAEDVKGTLVIVVHHRPPLDGAGDAGASRR